MSKKKKDKHTATTVEMPLPDKGDAHPAPGEKVWIAPKDPKIPVPYEARLRGGLMSGQRGLSAFGPKDNKKLQQPRVKKLTGPAEVVWNTWWARRYTKGEIIFAKKGAEK